jgi:hypothetical protein
MGNHLIPFSLNNSFRHQLIYSDFTYDNEDLLGNTTKASYYKTACFDNQTNFLEKEVGLSA